MVFLFQVRVAQVGWKVGNPPARHGHVAVNVNSALWVFSGSAGGNAVAHILDLHTKRWEAHPLSGVPPTATMCAAVVLYGTGIYFYGGRGDKGITTGLYRLDTVNFAWEQLQYTGTAPPYYHMSAALHGAHMVVFGGRSAEMTLSRDTYMLDLERLEWRQLETIGPAPSKRCAQCVAACIVWARARVARALIPTFQARRIEN